MTTIKYPPLLPTLEGTFQVLDDYYPFPDNSVKIPKGYITNGANIPRLLWIIVPPFFPKYLHAVVAHDYLCDKEDYKYADKCFERLLYQVEETYVTKSMVKAVKTYHKFKY